MSVINRILRKQYIKKQKKRLNNSDFSLFCNNCTGAFILHDLGLKFNSPCVNLFMDESDYIKFISNLGYYKNCTLKFISSDKNYPVAKLDDITINFMHYDSEEEASDKWCTRFARVKNDNMFFILHQREGCNDKILQEFDKLAHKNKVSFTCKPYSELMSNFCIKNREIDGYLDHLYLFKSKYTGKKYYDDFDYVEWFNTGTINK